jgi:sulfonate transport system substrate-binding protein
MMCASWRRMLARASPVRDAVRGIMPPLMKHLTALCATLALLASVLLGQAGNPNPPAPPLTSDAPFTVAVSTTTMEGSPVYVVDSGPLGARLNVINGGVRNLANHSAHAATNAETQLLIAGTPNVRLLFTVAEGLYRIVAKRSSGITTLADLKGKRVTTPRDTSAHYFLVRALASAGLAESDVTIVSLPREQMATGTAKGDADAISMWEPESQKAVELLGRDAIVFPNQGVYRELFSLYSTTEVMNDTRRRRELVEFVRALLTAGNELKTKPQPHFALVAKTIGQPADLISRAWEHHAWPFALPKDVLDVMEQEEIWVARNQKRTPRTRATLAAFIDASVLKEASAPLR